LSLPGSIYVEGWLSMTPVSDLFNLVCGEIIQCGIDTYLGTLYGLHESSPEALGDILEFDAGGGGVFERGDCLGPGACLVLFQVASETGVAGYIFSEPIE
jgi:hypothetical protein